MLAVCECVLDSDVFLLFVEGISVSFVGSYVCCDSGEVSVGSAMFSSRILSDLKNEEFRVILCDSRSAVIIEPLTSVTQ